MQANLQSTVSDQGEKLQRANMQAKQMEKAAAKASEGLEFIDRVHLNLLASGNRKALQVGTSFNHCSELTQENLSPLVW